MTSNQKLTKLILPSIILALTVVFFLFIVSTKGNDLSYGFLLAVAPPIIGCGSLLVISSTNDNPIPLVVTLLFAFLLISGNAYQIVIGQNSPQKILLVNIFALLCAAATLASYVLFIKKKVLINKRGYQLAIIVSAAIMLGMFLTLILFGTNIGGAKLWLRIGSMTLELSEIIKLLFFIFLALIYNSNMSVKNKILYGAIGLGVSSVFFTLLNEFGTIIIMFCVYLVSFYIHIRSRYSALMIGTFIIIMVVALAVIFGTHESIKDSSGFFAEKLNKIYARLTLEDTDQTIRALQGMINGGLFGANMNYVIDVFSIEADFALAGISQYFGLFIMLLCIAATGAIVYFVYMSSNDDSLNNRSRYKLSYILTVAIAVQTILSLCGNIGLPIAGVGAPCISSGGTQMLILYTEIAFIVYGLQSDSLIKSKPKTRHHHKNIRENYYVEDTI